ncbi:MAG: hypothetical protein ACTSRK_10120 [Promethearchaeota archaeon]
MIQNLIPTINGTEIHTGSAHPPCRTYGKGVDPLPALEMAAVVGTMGNTVTKGPSSHPENLFILADLVNLPKPMKLGNRFTQ